MKTMPDAGPVVAQDSVYILCPGGLVTGGAELLHQLAGALVRRGRDAWIVYTPVGSTFDMPAEYTRYGCRVAPHVPDKADVAVITPEVSTAQLANFRHAQHVIWWLSVDNYRGRPGMAAGWKVMARRLLFSDIPRPRDTIHLCQSAYARDYVARRFSARGVMLSDFLASEYFEAATQQPRRHAVAFNPRKGMAFTAALIKACPEIEFVRLENMARDQMRDALGACMVYVDFGHHPGKDRIPREAAMSGAVVVVARRGAAVYDEDMPIPERYKLPARTASIPALKVLIEDVFEHYEEHAAAQSRYRDAIAAEPAAFEEQVDRVFGTARSR